MLVGNSIGKAKQILKAKGEPAPVSGYDAFTALARLHVISENSLNEWNAVIGLRNRIVHEYMNIEMNIVLKLVSENKMSFVVEFLLSSNVADV